MAPGRAAPRGLSVLIRRRSMPFPSVRMSLGTVPRFLMAVGRAAIPVGIKSVELPDKPSNPSTSGAIRDLPLQLLARMTGAMLATATGLELRTTFWQDGITSTTGRRRSRGTPHTPTHTPYRILLQRIYQTQAFYHARGFLFTLRGNSTAVSYTHLRAHETPEHLV